MRLSDWRKAAPFKESMAPNVLATIDNALHAMGAERDPECYILWGDDPAARYLIFVPTPSGLVHINVRVAVPGEGPRAGAKVVRWSRVQLGELAVEIQGGHRLVTFQVEMQMLNGADTVADQIAGFAQALFAAVDGRPIPTSPAPRRVSAKSVSSSSTGGASAKAAKAAKTMKASKTAGSAGASRARATVKGSSR